jgi:D-beta-D-heptose 7-phosphate kinase/D-beta-D-heptose 1-phosphate adenosyltransferase
MHNIDQQLAKFAKATVLCIGDLMLDDFVYGDVSRISPEAPALVIAVRREDKVIGGAGNVARGIAALGAQCIFVGVTGVDDAGRMLARAFRDECQAVETHIVVDVTRPTTRKVRFVSEHHSTHARRLGGDRRVGLTSSAAGSTPAWPRCRARISGCSPTTARAYSRRASSAQDRRGPTVKAVVVDPKGLILAFIECNLITPNRKELADATRRTLASDADIVAAALEIARIVECEAVLVTRSEAGMTLCTKSGGVLYVPAYPVKVRDVSGAGDTVTAVLAVMLATLADIEPAVRAANAAAAVVVGKRGTATVSAAELRSRIRPAASSC